MSGCRCVCQLFVRNSLLASNVFTIYVVVIESHLILESQKEIAWIASFLSSFANSIFASCSHSSFLLLTATVIDCSRNLHRIFFHNNENQRKECWHMTWEQFIFLLIALVVVVSPKKNHTSCLASHRIQRKNISLSINTERNNIFATVKQ